MHGAMDPAALRARARARVPLRLSLALLPGKRQLPACLTHVPAILGPPAALQPRQEEGQLAEQGGGGRICRHLAFLTSVSETERRKP